LWAAGPALQDESSKLIFSSYSWSGYEAAMNQVIDNWIEDYTEGMVEVERQYAPWDDYWGKLQTQIAAGTPPDLGIADYSRVVSYAKNNVILNISNLVELDSFNLDEHIAAAVAQYRWAEGDFDTGNPDGDLYGLPTDAAAMIMVYNKSMFDEAGVAHPTVDWTWDDFLNAAIATTKDDQSQYGFYMPISYLWRGIWIQAAGGAFHSADYRQSLLNSPETRAAMTWLWDLYYTHRVAVPPGGSGGPHPFLGRTAAMALEGVWWLPDIANALEDDEWDVCMFPKHPSTGKRTTTIEADGWWIFSGSKEPELAWRLMQVMASGEGQRQFDALGYLIPSSISEVAQDWYSRTPPENRVRILDNILEDSVKVDITHFEVIAVQSVVDPIIAQSFADGSDMGQALETAEQVMNVELERAWTTFER
jgi:multiple sugar transport system substrate-binding protein